MITLNFLTSIKNYFSNFILFKIPFISDTRTKFELSHYLYENDIAFSYPYEEYLYFKGDPQAVIKYFKKFGEKKKIIYREEYQRETFTPKDQIIIKPIVYQSFESLLETKGFRLLSRRKKRMVPNIDLTNSEILKYREKLIVPLTNDIYVLRGIKYMLEIRSSGYAILWLDLYSPPYDIKNHKFLSPREIRELGIIDEYHSCAVVESSIRKKLLEKILKVVCGNDYLRLKFLDNDILLFSKYFIETPTRGENAYVI